MTIISKLLKRVYLLLVSTFFLFCSSVLAQIQFETLDFQTNGRVIQLEVDTVNDYLYVGGDFNVLNSQPSSAIALYTDSGWITRGTGYIVGQVYAMEIFRDTLYIGGHDPYQWLKKWDGLNWLNVSSDTAYGEILDLEVIDDELWVAGYFDSIGNVPADGLARWDGQQWKTAYDLPRIDSLDDFNRINTVCKYKGNIYIGGNFSDVNGNLNEIAMWNGSEWTDVGGGIKPHTFSAVFNFTEYDGDLYVMGRFLASEGNADNNIMRWNGEEWLPCGGGVMSSAGYATVFDNKLWVTGQMSSVAGLPADGLAIWDGEEWCAPRNDFSSWPGPVIEYHDSLFIGGSFQTIDGMDYSYIAKSNGEGYQDTCGVLWPVGMKDEYLNDQTDVQIYPNPTDEQLTIASETTVKKVDLINSQGILVTSFKNI
jgi:hypothetical protein